MKKLINFWLEWDWDPNKRKILTQVNGSHSHELADYDWSDVGKKYITIFCDSNTFANISRVAESERLDIKTDEKKWTHQIGRTKFKLIRGGTEKKREGMGTQAFKLLCKLEPKFIENHPQTEQDFWKISNDWKFAPRFENLQQGIYKNVYRIDIKSCYASIMKDYPLPCGKSKWISEPQLIEQKLKVGKEGFISFKIMGWKTPRNGQIPFLPNHYSEVKSRVQGRFFLYTKSFKAFQKQYTKRGKIVLVELWTFKEKKGCVDKFLSYCEELKKNPKTEKEGKMFANSLYGYLGKNSFSGYHYHPFHLAVNHLAILKTYYLYRQFKKEDILAIRVDCIYVKGELPNWTDKEKEKYHIEKYSKVGFKGEENVFIYDTSELLARLVNNEEEREKLKAEFLG